MLFMLQMAAISKSIIFTFDVIFDPDCPLILGEIAYLAMSCKDIKHPNTNDSIELPHVCSTVINTTLPAMFLALAVLLNINKWIYFTMRI